MRSQRNLLICALACATVVHGSAFQDAPPSSLRLNNVEFAGLSRYTAEQILALSGLKVGQFIDVPGMSRAVQTLIETGLFKRLSYSYRYKGTLADVTFQAEEESNWSVPVVFDNFVWFEDEDLILGVSEEVPSFDGLAPNSNAVVARVTRALDRLLKDRGVAGRTSHRSWFELAGGRQLHIFTAEDLARDLALCKLEFPGASRIEESRLVEASRSLIRSNYSRNFVHTFAASNLVPIYRENGHLQVRFETARAMLEDSPGSEAACVTVAVPVEEGPAFSWGTASWSGNTAVPAAELGKLLGMKTGDLANGLKIDEGIRKAVEEYRNHGFVTARIDATPAFESTTVSYSFVVNQGPQYRMGGFSVTGLPDSNARRLRERWTLRPGQVFNASYIDDFRDVIRRESGLGVRKYRTSLSLNSNSLTVDVSIAFEE